MRVATCSAHDPDIQSNTQWQPSSVSYEELRHVRNSMVRNTSYWNWTVAGSFISRLTVSKFQLDNQSNRERKVGSRTCARVPILGEHRSVEAVAAESARQVDARVVARVQRRAATLVDIYTANPPQSRVSILNLEDRVIFLVLLGTSD